MTKKLISIFLLINIFLSLETLSKENDIKNKNNINQRILIQEETSEKSDDIIILHTNDVHCGLTDYIGYDGLQLYKNELKTKYKNIITVDGGDHVQGGAIGLLSKGMEIINIMNKIEYDVVVLGNHEFDYGLEQLDTFSQTLNCRYISANFCLRKDKKPIYEPYKIINAGNKKIAFIGVTTPQTLSKTFLHNIIEDGEMKYDFLNDRYGEELYEKIQDYIDEVKGKGAHYVVIVAHLGNDGDASPEYTSKGLLSKLYNVDIILDGHTHKIYNIKSENKNGKEALLLQGGTKLSNLCIIKIKTNGTITSEILSEIPPPENYSPMPIYRDKLRVVDPEMNKYINDIINKYSDALNKKIGYSNFNLLINLKQSGDSSDQISRSEESTLCNLIADSMREAGQSNICILNAGGVRTDLIKGDISYQNILNILPFSNSIIVKEIPGQDILDALEFGVKDLPGKTSRFPQVSGIKYKVNINIKSPVVIDNKEMFVEVKGKRRVYDVKVGDKKINENKIYNVSFQNYIGNGGDGYSMFSKYEISYDTGKVDNEVFMNYIIDVLHGDIPERYNTTQGRIIIEDKNTYNSSYFLKNILKVNIILFIAFIII